jgi:hypothetical protein
MDRNGDFLQGGAALLWCGNGVPRQDNREESGAFDFTIIGGELGRSTLGMKKDIRQLRPKQWKPSRRGREGWNGGGRS